MKTKTIYRAILAGGLFLFAACAKEPVGNTSMMTITANATPEAIANASDPSDVSTKTYIDNNTILWDAAGEEMNLYLIESVILNGVKSSSYTKTDDSKSATFTFNIETTGNETLVGGIYPASRCSSISQSGGSNTTYVNVQLPSIQSATAAGYDPDAYIMVAQPTAFSEVSADGTWTASYRRATALNKITLKNLPASASFTSVSISTADKKLAGTRRIDVSTGNSEESITSSSNSITINYATPLTPAKADDTAETGNIDVWFTSWGVELAENETLTVEVTSADYKYTRTINARATGISFKEGYLNTLGVNMAEATTEAIETFSGNYLIGAYSGTNWMIMSTTAVDNYFSGLSVPSATSSIDKVLYSDFYVVSDVDKSYLWSVSPSTTTSGYTIKPIDDNSNYLSLSGESATLSSTEANVNIVKNDDGTFDITGLTTSSNPLRASNSNQRFRPFNSTSSSYPKVVLIPWVEDTTPMIVVQETSKTVAADATTVTFDYVLRNITGEINPTITDNSSGIISSVSAADNVLTVNLNTNSDQQEKSATVTLSYEGAESVDLTVIQEAALAENIKVDVLTASLFAATGGTYANFSDVTGTTSSAVYAGRSATNSGQQRIHLNNTSPSGIVSTTSGGYIRKVTVVWNSSTNASGVLAIYGSNTAFTSSSELYSMEPIATIANDGSTSVDIPGDYTFIGLRDNSTYTLYFDRIEITWEVPQQ